MVSPNDPIHASSELVEQVLQVLARYSVPTLICDHVTKLLKLHEAGKICSICGCTDDEACVTDEGPCSWVQPGLCSACVSIFTIEHELPPLRAVYTTDFRAVDQDDAIAVFRNAHPGHLIRKIDGEPFEDPLRPARRPQKGQTC